MAFITCKDLYLGYGTDVIVKNLNFQIEEGDYLCIIGENGAGKSTLMKTLLGLIPSVSGDIHYGDGLQKKEVGYLPQQSAVQREFPASVWEVVLSGTITRERHRLLYSKRQKDLAASKLKQLGIYDLRRKSYRHLSGGQQQRVLLARALCATSKVLLLDEPVTGLDPVATKDLYELISDLNKQGVTILMVTHDLKAMEYANTVLHVDGDHSIFDTKEHYQTTEKWLRYKEWEEYND